MSRIIFCCDGLDSVEKLSALKKHAKRLNAVTFHGTRNFASWPNAQDELRLFEDFVHFLHKYPHANIVSSYHPNFSYHYFPQLRKQIWDYNIRVTGTWIKMTRYDPESRDGHLGILNELFERASLH